MKKMKTMLLMSMVLCTMFGNSLFAKPIDKDPIVGGMESLTYTFKDSPVRFPKNYEIVVTEKNATIKIEDYTGNEIKHYSESREIKHSDWKEILSLAGKLQKGKSYDAKGGTGFQSYGLTKKNAGTIESYQLNWTSLSTDKINANTKKLTEKIKSLVSDYDKVLVAQKVEKPILGGVEMFSFKNSAPYPDPTKNFEIVITKKGAKVQYFSFGSEKELIGEREVSATDWAELVKLAGNLQSAEVFNAPEGATGYQSYTLIKKNAGTLEPYKLVWTSMSVDKIDEGTSKLIEKIVSIVSTYQEVSKEK